MQIAGSWSDHQSNSYALQALPNSTPEELHLQLPLRVLFRPITHVRKRTYNLRELRLVVLLDFLAIMSIPLVMIPLVQVFLFFVSSTSVV